MSTKKTKEIEDYFINIFHDKTEEPEFGSEIFIYNPNSDCDYSGYCGIYGSEFDFIEDGDLWCYVEDVMPTKKLKH